MLAAAPGKYAALDVANMNLIDDGGDVRRRGITTIANFIRRRRSKGFSPSLHVLTHLPMTSTHMNKRPFLKKEKQNS